jgi:hypothetical protein
MHNPVRDTELDELSREAAGHYHAPGTPDWEKMSRELDKVLPREKRKKRPAAWWWLFPLLVTGIIGYTWFSGNDTKSSSPVTVQQPAAGKNASAVTGSTALHNDHASNTVSGNTGNASAQKSTRSTTIPAASSTNNIQAGSRTTVTKEDTRKSNIASTDTYSATAQTGTAVAKEDVQKNNAASAGDHSAIAQPQGTTAAKTDTPATQNSNTGTQSFTQQLTTASSPVIKDSAAPANEQPATTVGNSATTRVTVRKPGRGFSVGIVAGTDMSTVRFRYGNTPGLNIGVLAGYHFSNTWSLHTGLIYTQKNYKLAGQDFHAPKGSWASYYKILTVEGDCRMWELPLLARYTFAPGKATRNHYFLSTGLSSYFMTGENYEYYYYYQNNPTTRNASYPSGNTHILSIMHLSAGLEKKLSKNLSLQIEPYAKIPLAGVGVGQIRLSSFGVNFGLQFRQPRR